ncbi:hypothetical protein [Paraburkholderia bryophila]|uniref:TubC N-terminal docking domain-containing protein n=1 Tax=Paraburkholderia bryophila TaxID=420952 RepID=A0A329CQD9_9BURK|nr:hypothetical protein [Paraburkholderia bryophila]RAS35861.1 hypothetical protein BX591_104191 [Paraburkholderia bryophila]
MSIVHILSKAQSLGVRLWLAGDIVKMRGAADAIAAIKPDIAAHKSEVLTYLRAASNDLTPVPADCAGALRHLDGGLYLPWGPYVDQAQLRAMQRELFEVVDELAKLEGWKKDNYDHTMMCIERQPASTLRPDLAYFQSRLAAARADQAARDALAKRSWKFE